METFVIVPKDLFTKLAESDDLKWNKLAMKKHIELEAKAKEKAKTDFEEDTLKNVDSFEKLIANVSKSGKNRTEKLLYELQSRHISWDMKTGKLFYKNKPLKQEFTIQDLIKYISRKTSKIPSHILKQILLLIERANISQRNIVNPFIRDKVYSKIPKNWYG